MNNVNANKMIYLSVLSVSTTTLLVIRDVPLDEINENTWN